MISSKKGKDYLREINKEYLESKIEKSKNIFSKELINYLEAGLNAEIMLLNNSNEFSKDSLSDISFYKSLVLYNLTARLARVLEENDIPSIRKETFEFFRDYIDYYRKDESGKLLFSFGAPVKEHNSFRYNHLHVKGDMRMYRLSLFNIEYSDSIIDYQNDVLAKIDELKKATCPFEYTLSDDEIEDCNRTYENFNSKFAFDRISAFNNPYYDSIEDVINEKMLYKRNEIENWYFNISKSISELESKLSSITSRINPCKEMLEYQKLQIKIYKIILKELSLKKNMFKEDINYYGSDPKLEKKLVKTFPNLNLNIYTNTSYYTK